MDVEISLSSEDAKRRVLRLLRSESVAAESGPIRLAHPFCLAVEASSPSQADALLRLVRSVDPLAEPVPGSAPRRRTAAAHA